jgi:predicted dinucleotide-utilizing enzyme
MYPFTIRVGEHTQRVYARNQIEAKKKIAEITVTQASGVSIQERLERVQTLLVNDPMVQELVHRVAVSLSPYSLEMVVTRLVGHPIPDVQELVNYAKTL